ncbi:MAG: 7-carboxy-7-deazaguanine synthase [Bacteroidia bacterium]|nr:MAG: 7-carboxy-7-deazaguanine synthase [Bacteroidia bacterium]
MDTLEKLDLVNKGTHLPVMEEFYSLQGEGFNTGKPAYFIRIGGCDIGCHWCDVKESWDAAVHPIKAVEEVVRNVVEQKAKAVVITGGEPTQYNLFQLTSILKQNQIQIYLETSGAYEIRGYFDWICISPKKMQMPLDENLRKANELKVIVYNKHDFLFAEEMSKKVKHECHLFLQPEWSKRERLLPEIIQYIQRNTKWRLSLQTHKYIHIP